MRRFVPWIAVGITALLLAIAALWLFLARQIEGRVVAWAEARRAEGYALIWQRLDLGGFPYRFNLTFVEPRIAKEGWSAEALELSAVLLPWRQDRIDLSALNLALNGPGGTAKMEAAAAALLLADGRITGLVLDGSAATAWMAAGELGRARSAHMTIDRFAPWNADWRTESMIGTLSLTHAQPAERFASSLLFAEPFNLVLDGAVKGPLTTFSDWRDAGGTLDLTRLALSWGPLNLDGNATIALDPQMRPLGAGTAKLRGLDPTLDRLVARRQIKPKDASIAKIVLGLMAKQTPEGVSEVTVPLSAQDGRLFLGPVPILPLPRLAD